MPLNVNATMMVKKQLVKIRRNIRKKVLALNLNRSEKDRQFLENYDAIINPLKEVAKFSAIMTTASSKPTTKASKLKMEPFKRENDDPDADPNTTGETEYDPNTTGGTEYDLDTTDTSNYQADEDADEIDKIQNLNQFYSHLMKSKKQVKCDRVFGIHVDEDGQAYLGNARIEINGNNIVLNGESYTSTTGLYELLFLKDPSHYTPHDKEVYAKMLISSNAIYRQHQPKHGLKGSKSKKYTKIIKPNIQLVQQQQRRQQQIANLNASINTSTPRVGRGHFDSKLRVENKPYRAIYWDDPNELIDRLWLLHASQRAGNNIHSNEIGSIEEELREARYIY